MQRRGFLALFPAISALPFINAKEVIQEKDLITIVKPEIIQTPTIATNDLFDIRNLEVVVRDRATGKVIGTGYLRQLTIDQGLSFGNEMHPVSREINIEASLYDIEF
jgi:hypothetical protein